MNWSTANPPRVSSVPIDSWSFNSWRARYCRSSAAEEEEKRRLSSRNEKKKKKMGDAESLTTSCFQALQDALQL